MLKELKKWAYERFTNGPNYDALQGILKKHIKEAKVDIPPVLLGKDFAQGGPDFRTRVFMQAGDVLYSALGFDDPERSPKGTFHSNDVYFFSRKINPNLSLRKNLRELKYQTWWSI
jgi:hypothetical protein